MNMISKHEVHEYHNIRFHVSNVCNLQCKYCHVFKEAVSDNVKLMDFNIIKSTLDYCLSLSKKHPYQFFKFSFYGGEPLFNWKVIKKALSYGNKKIPGRIEWILNTNGTLITEEKAKAFFKEGVDVHISIDGPDEKSNNIRRYKTGRSVLRKTLKALDILKQNHCRVQFDSCLTGANIDALEGLINLAAKNQVDRIYLALADEKDNQSSDFFNVEKIAGRLIDALKYAQKMDVVLGGPWKSFYPWFMPQSKTIVKNHPHLIADVSGSLYFPPFPEFKFGNTDQIKTVSGSNAYKTAVKKITDITKSCAGCDLEQVCSGYLKGMVKYHTGTFEGHEQECELARIMFDKYRHLACDNETAKDNVKILTQNPDWRKTQFVHSKHLSIEPLGKGYRIVHGLSGLAIKASIDMIEFIELFKQPRTPSDILKNYRIPKINLVVPDLIKKNILLDLSADEELAYLEKLTSGFPKNRIDSAHCICFYPPKEKKIAGQFVQFIEELYLGLSQKIQPARQKIIIHLCRDYFELGRFWFEQTVPQWIKAFVSCRRILVADINKINIDRDYGFKQGMSHELVHILLGDFNVKIPIWLEEGVCEYFSKQDPTERLLALINQKEMLSFEQLESRTIHTLLDIDNANTEDNICYRQSHSFVSYLCRVIGEKKIITFIKSINLQKNFPQIFHEKTGKHLKEMEKVWRKTLLN